MSQTAVEKALGKLVTDECFRRRFFRDPIAASFAAGLELSQAEVEALSRLQVETIARFSACVDARICRLPHEEEEDQRPAPTGACDAEEDRRRVEGRAAIGTMRWGRKGSAGKGTTPPDAVANENGSTDSSQSPDEPRPAVHAAVNGKEGRR